MLPGTFEKKLKKLNSQLRVFSNGEVQAVYLYDGMHAPSHICGIDRNSIPEFTIYDDKGHIIKSGWRRVVEILIAQKLTKKSKAQDVFQAVFDGRHSKMVIVDDPIQRAIKTAATPSTINKTSGIDMKKDDVMDISKMIREQK